MSDATPPPDAPADEPPPVAPPPDLRAVLESAWVAPPGQPDSRIPVDEAGLAAVEAALPSPVPPELQPIADAVAWGRSQRPVGGAAAFGAVMVAIACFPLWKATGAPGWMTAAGVFLLAAPIQLRFVTEPQLVANARRVAGERTLDERFLQALADGPPLLAPFGLLARAAAHGVLAPLSAPLLLARAGRTPLAAGAALALLAVAGAGVAWAPAPPEPPAAQAPPAPPTAEAAFVLGGQRLSVFPTAAERAGAPFLADSAPDRLVARVAATDEDALLAGLVAGLGDSTRTDQPTGAGCTAALHAWDGDRPLRLRLTRCADTLDVEAWSP